MERIVCTKTLSCERDIEGAEKSSVATAKVMWREAHGEMRKDYECPYLSK